MNRINDIGVLLRRNYRRLPQYAEANSGLHGKSSFLFDELVMLNEKGCATTGRAMTDVAIRNYCTECDDVDLYTEHYTRPYSMQELDMYLRRINQFENSDENSPGFYDLIDQSDSLNLTVMPSRLLIPPYVSVQILSI